MAVPSLLPYLEPTATVKSDAGEAAEPVLSPQERIQLLQMTLAQMSALLALSNSEFAGTIAQVVPWLDHYLHAVAPRVTASQPLFAGFEHSAESPESSFVMRLETKLVRKALQCVQRVWIEASDSLDLPLRMTVCRVYAHTNLASVGTLWDQWIAAAGSGSTVFEEDVEYAKSVFIDCVRGIQKRIEKSVDAASSGKGKGKGKSAASGSGSSANNDASLAKEDVQMMQDLGMLTDAVLQFEGLVLASSCSSTQFSDKFVSSDEFFAALVGVYGIVNIHAASKSLPQSADDTPVASMEELGVLPPSMDPKLATIHRNLKLAVLSLIDALLSISFFNPLMVDPTPETSIERVTPLPRLPQSNPESQTLLVEKLCNTLLMLLDASPIDSPSKFLTSTAPLLVDFEVETGVSDRLKQVKLLMTGVSGGDDARLEFLIVSLEQMLAFSGNSVARQQRITERIQRAEEFSTRKTVKAGKKKKGALKSKSSGQEADMPDLDDGYIHRTILISQVHDLFPELGEGFIEACLVALNNDPEMVIMKVIEGDFPQQVEKLDRSMPRSAPPARTGARKTANGGKTSKSAESWPSLVQEESSILSSRKNVFDNDEFDVFGASKKVDAAKVIWGKKEKTAASILDTKDAGQKDAILALHASTVREEEEYARELQAQQLNEQRIYDDEYDDSYDSTDIKLAGTVELRMLDETEDGTNAANARVAKARAVESVGGDSKQQPTAWAVSSGTDLIEQELYALAVGSGKSVLEGSARKGVARQRLKARLGWSDEMIEGWYKMYLRDPRQQRRMAEQNEFKGNRRDADPVPQNKNRVENEDDNESSDSDEEENGTKTEGSIPSNRGGRGGRGGGRGGSRGGRGNHSRRNQHAKKMSRGMMGGE
ncbi:hypothetical protein HDU80_006468 [Chytriomyces hyalinus]|nr:hypothetical protein HDU80_006468 [Chytriomyces hyalinus]